MKRVSDRLVLSALGLVLALVVCVAYLLGVVLRLPLTGAPAEVTVDLPRTGGLYEGSSATYRGVRVGTVTSVGLGRTGGVEARVRLRDGAEVPRRTRAVVRSLSPVGEQYLDFQPAGSAAPFLADGDRVAADAVDVPVSLATAAQSLDGLLDQVDPDDVQTVLRELSSAVGGAGDDLDSLLDSADATLTELDDAWPETDSLLRNGEEVGELFERHQDDLASTARSARLVAGFLADFDPEFSRILRTTPGDFRTVRTLLTDLRATLPPTVDGLLGVTTILSDRAPHLRELTRTLPYGLGRFAGTFEDGWMQVDLQLQGYPECDYGTPRDEPTSVDRRPLDTTGTCPSATVPRGAAHAPPPLRR